MAEDTSSQSGIHVGIDLGTTNTVMAVCKKPRFNILRSFLQPINQYVTATRIDRNFYLPSVLFFDTDAVKVGLYAHDRKSFGADKRILYNTKIDMGREIEYANGYTPVDAAAEILKVCYDTILKTIMMKGDTVFPDVTITVPASFRQNQITDTLKAASMAGFKKVSILEEPVAALYSYINDQVLSGDSDTIDFSTPKRMMVYDIGGGTCDICVVDLQVDENGSYDIHFVITGRYTEFGGNDFDEQAAIGILNKLFKRYQIPDSAIESPEVRNDLVTQIMPYCEGYKKWYSTQLAMGYDEDNITNVTFGKLSRFLNYDNVELDATYKEYKEFTKIFFDENYRHPVRDLTDKMRDKHVLKPVFELLKKLRSMGEHGIDCVFLTGGMSEYLPIKTALENFCKCPVVKAESPMDAVALGAAMSKFITAKIIHDPSVDISESSDEDFGAEENNDEVSAPEEKIAAVPAKKIPPQDERPRLAEAIFIDVENQLPMKIIDANVTIPCKGEVDHEFHVGSNGVRFHLFAGQSQWDPEMRVLYDYAQTFNTLVQPNTVAKISYEIDKDRFLKMQLRLEDARQQVFDLTVDTFKK